MPERWFTEPGAVGTLEIERRRDSWFLSSPGVETDVECFLDTSLGIEDEPAIQEPRVSVSKYIRGGGDQNDRIFLSAPSDTEDGQYRTPEETDESGPADTTTSSTADANTDSLSDSGPPVDTDKLWEMREYDEHGSSNSASEPTRSRTDDSAGNSVSGSAKGDYFWEGAKGMITTYKEDGYGFIKTADLWEYGPNGEKEPKDFFFHVSEYPGETPEEGERFRFDVESKDDGLQAVNMDPIDSTLDDMETTVGEYVRSLREEPDEESMKPGPGSMRATESDIENFSDERKFR